MKTQLQSYSVTRPITLIQNIRMDGIIAYKTGTYNSKIGTVVIYQQGCKRKDAYTDKKVLRLDFYKDGSGYYKSIFGKTYTDIGIARKCHEFLKELKQIP